MPKIFSSFLSGFNVISEKKKKVIALTEASFSPIYVDLQKKKVLCLSSASFLRDLCDIPERGTMNRSCLRFLAGNKNAGFWREKKRRNSQNFSAKMPEKISHFSHFFALIGNTGGDYVILCPQLNKDQNKRFLPKIEVLFPRNQVKTKKKRKKKVFAAVWVYIWPEFVEFIRVG